MISFGVIPDTFLWHRLKQRFERSKVLCAPDFGTCGRTEDKIAETEILDHKLPQFVQQQRRIFQEERRTDETGAFFVLLQVRLEQDGNVGVIRFHVLCELDPCLRILFPAAKEIDVRNNTEDVVAILFVVTPCLFIRRAEEDLRPRPHPQKFMREVDPFRDEPLRLLQRLGIDERKIRRIEADVILDKDDRLCADDPCIVVDVELVFEILDDGDDDAEVPLPDEHPVEHRRIVMNEQLR